MNKEIIFPAPQPYCPPPNVYYLYALFLGNVIVYIGSTNDLLARLGIHSKSKDMVWDSASYIIIDEMDRYEWETEAIIQYKPKYNLNLPKKHDRYQKIGAICAAMGLKIDNKEFLKLHKDKAVFSDYFDKETIKQTIRDFAFPPYVEKVGFLKWCPDFSKKPK